LDRQFPFAVYRRTSLQAAAGCGACHSPRYVTEQLAAAQRSLAIGEMKFNAARGELKGEELARIETLLTAMRDADLRNLRLGLGHQSPDH
jgi:hypothetical protein